MKTNQLFNLNNKEINTFINQLKSPVYIFDFKSIKCDTDVSEVNNSDNSPQFLYELYINQDYYYSKNENYINDVNRQQKLDSKLVNLSHTFSNEG